MNESSSPFKNSYLAIIVLISALFPRVLVSFGAPGIFKFLHFPVVLLSFILVFPYIWTPLTKRLLFGLSILFWAIAISALVNSAGIINLALDFLLLSEPFLLLILMVTERMSQSDISRLQATIIVTVIIHTLLAYYQYFTLGIINPDWVKGIFLDQGAGHHVAGAVALTAAVYFYFTYSSTPLGWRVFLSSVVASVVVLSDSKQVILVFLVALVAMLAWKLNNFKRFIQYTLLFFVMFGAAILTAYTILPALAFWADVDLIKKGLEAKMVGISIANSLYSSFLSWIFGLGPGHTVGRLASLLPDYYDQFKSLGATISRVTEMTEQARVSNFVSNEKTGSSMWSPFFFWAGLWGDLGGVGLIAYIFLWYTVFRELCQEDLSQYFVLTIVIFGMVFSWLEEPGYMLFVIALIGLNWQHHLYKIIQPKYAPVDPSKTLSAKPFSLT